MQPTPAVSDGYVYSTLVGGAHSPHAPSAFITNRDPAQELQRKPWSVLLQAPLLHPGQSASLSALTLSLAPNQAGSCVSWSSDCTHSSSSPAGSCSGSSLLGVPGCAAKLELPSSSRLEPDTRGGRAAASCKLLLVVIC